MFEIMFGLFVTLIEVICFKVFIEAYAEKKREYKLPAKAVIVCTLAVMLFVAGRITSGHFLYSAIMTIIISTVVWWVYFDEDIRKIFNLTVSFFAFLYVQSFVTESIIYELFYKKINALEDVEVVSRLVMLMSKVVLFVLVLIIKHFYKQKDDNLFEGRDWLVFSMMPLFTVFAISGVIGNWEVVEGGGQKEVIIGILLGLVAVNIAIFYFGSIMLKRERELRRQSIFRERAQGEMKVYHAANENYEKQKRRIHEFKNQINCIIEPAGNKKYDELDAFLKQIDDEIRTTTDLIDTNNALINSIINSKLREAKEKGITFVVKVNDLSDIGMEDTDVVTILSNLLNNAIEACEKCKDRLIKLKFVKENGKVIISVVNSMHEPPVLVGEKYITSKKENREMHGIGIENIISAVGKYKGSYVIEPKGKEFCFSIVIA